MSSREDIVVVERGVEGPDSISSLPRTFMEALSAIQEQSFVEAGLADPDHYSQSFTNKHRVTFFKVGFFTAVEDSILTVIGMFLFVLSERGIIPLFGTFSPSSPERAIAWIVATFPYMVVVFLVVQTYSKISGTISKKMGFYLALGFSVGVMFITGLFFMAGYGAATEFADSIYMFFLKWESLLSFLYGLADFFWYQIRSVLVQAVWTELKAAAGIIVILALIYYSRVFWLWREKRIRE